MDFTLEGGVIILRPKGDVMTNFGLILTLWLSHYNKNGFEFSENLKRSQSANVLGVTWMDRILVQRILSGYDEQRALFL